MNDFTTVAAWGLTLNVGLTLAFILLRPHLRRRRKLRGWQALLARLVVTLWLLAIVGYYGFFLRWFQNELFGSERTLCLQLA